MMVIRRQHILYAGIIDKYLLSIYYLCSPHCWRGPGEHDKKLLTLYSGGKDRP